MIKRPDLCPVMLFSGKGGVGKTTLAASTAVHLAASGSRVLVLSTDPAHNLSDVVDAPLGPHPRQIAPRLDAMEVDAKGMFGEVAEAQQGGAMGSLLKLASETPGIDEFGAIEVLLQVLESAQHDVVVVDTAPTGHTLRLLMVPELLDGWLGTLLSMRTRLARAGRLLKRLLPGSTPAAAEIEADLTGSRERIRVLRDQLTDADQAQIVLVSIPEEMSVLETTRTMQMLAGHGMPVGTVVVNQLQPESAGCDHCKRRRTLHLMHLERLREAIGDTPLRIVESQAHAIVGVEALARMGALLWDGATMRNAAKAPENGAAGDDMA